MKVHIVEHPNTAHADVHLYNGPQVNAPNSSPIKTAASIRAILLGWIIYSVRCLQLKILGKDKTGYKPKCTISFKRNVANIAKYASN